jgi:hypothetical protein
MPPSNLVTSMGAVRVSVPFDAGIGTVARLEREKKFIGEDWAGPAATAAANAMMMAAMEDFMMMILMRELVLEDVELHGLERDVYVSVKESVLKEEKD